MVDTLQPSDHWSARPFWQNLLVQLLLIAVGAIVFALAFPSFVSKWGWAPLAYVALIPVAVVVHRARWPEVFAFGFLYGLTTYIIHNYWLGGFHPLAVLLVPLIYATYFFMLFPMLKLADTLMPRYGYLLQMAMWMSYEYMRTQGFLGYSYGIIGYSQYLFLPLVRLSSLTGVWGVSLLVVFPSFYLGAGLRDGWRGLPVFLRAHRLPAIAWLVAFVLAIGYGVATRVDYSEAPTWRVALIQQNADPWVGGYPAYRRSLDISMRLSREALEHDPDVVVWSETSVVPPIDFHMRFRTSRESHEIVSDLIDFLDDQDTPFIIGNSSARFLRGASGEPERIDYNAVIVHHDGAFTEPYRKVHLVPFTEHFPYRRTLPWLYDLLMESGSNHWGHGDEFTVFEVDGIRFSTPICFEDTFGYLTREFALNGAELFVNLTNDLWSRSVAASMQHMIMAVFRATETRRTMVRSTNGGMTTIIDPNGRILDLYPPFVEGYLIGDAPLYVGDDSLYLLWGDWFAYLMLVTAFAGVFIAAFFAVRRARTKDR